MTGLKLVRDHRSTTHEDPDPPAVRIHASVCYDFIVSLRAVFNPRTFTRTRGWSADARRQLEPELQDRGRFLFQGFETALGYGASRLIPALPAAAGPTDLIEAIRVADAAALALLMLDTGETERRTLEAYARILDGDASGLSDALAGLPAGWSSRCRRVLMDPRAVQLELVDVLESYLQRCYASQIDAVELALASAVSAAESLVTLLPTADAIEQLTGGYTLGEDIEVRSITLAPSVFIHPFMATRLDEASRDALIIYGVHSDIFDGFEPVPIQRGLAEALKALADSNRLTLLGLLAKEPMYGTELVTALRLSQPTIHHHLAQLRAAGLVRQQREKGGMRYSIRRESADGILRSLDALVSGDQRLAANADDSTRRKSG